MNRERALKLRLSGRSYSQISRQLGVAKSTLSGWLANVEISLEAQRKIEDRGRAKAIEALIKKNKKQTTLAQERATRLKQDFSGAIGGLSRRDILIAARAVLGRRL